MGKKNAEATREKIRRFCLTTFKNKNSFLTNAYPAGHQAGDFQSTNEYERKGDIFLRASYNIVIVENKFDITPSVLPIFHLGDDSFTDTNGNITTIDGSQGLTLNGNLFLH